MHIFLWVLQVLLSLHTLMGAVWKLYNSTEVVPSLSAIPPVAWMTISVFEVFCAIGLILPAFNKRYWKFVPMSAIGIAAVMALYCVVHLASGEPDKSPIIYWSVVAIIAGFIAYGRTMFKRPFEN